MPRIQIVYDLDDPDSGPGDKGRSHSYSHSYSTSYTSYGGGYGGSFGGGRDPSRDAKITDMLNQRGLGYLSRGGGGGASDSGHSRYTTEHSDDSARYSRPMPSAGRRTSFIPQEQPIRAPPNEFKQDRDDHDHSLSNAQKFDNSKDDAAYEAKCRELRMSGKLFEDPDFPAGNSIVYPSQRFRNFDFKRPHQLVSNPEFITEGISRFDVVQGELGDCWLLAAVASLSMHKGLFEQVIPEDQSFHEDKYCGMFRFRFWQFGEWKEVVVDDRLPCTGTRLNFMHSKDKNEFWSALLEKAYAKLCGSYEALSGGAQSEAMEDFTGGLCETFDLTERSKLPKGLYKILMKNQKQNSLMGCSVDAEDDQIEAQLPNGLIVGHAYSITDVKEVDVMGSTAELVRIRNPWGNEAEWKGNWGDNSSQWNSVAESEKERLGIVKEDDGEFWMSFADFVTNFTKLEICHLGPESLGAHDHNKGRPKRRWEECIEHGSWKKNVNAGGCRNFLTTFWTNPQFRVNVVDPDEDDDDNTGTIIVGLMQKDTRKRNIEFFTIGYTVYEIKTPLSGPADLKFFRQNRSVAKSDQFINNREVCTRHKLPPGEYLIVPSTFEPGEEAEFILRIFSEKANESCEMDNRNEMVEVADHVHGRRAQGQRSGAQLHELNEEEARKDRALRKAFSDFAGPKEKINAFQLRDILNASLRNEISSFEGFTAESCRSMIALLDYNFTGTMEYEEFKVLWDELALLKAVFKKHDYDNNGYFDATELRDALNASGYRVSNRVFNGIAQRYAHPEKGCVFFEDYILLAIRLKTIFNNWNGQQKDAEGSSIVHIDQYLLLMLYV